MEDEREQQAQRIRAARDWLEEAGESLEQGKGVKGDLKVMLAQAELARAKELKRPSRLRHWGRRVLPLATACSLLALGLFLQPAMAPPSAQPQEVSTQTMPAAPSAVPQEEEAEAARDASAAAPEIAGRMAAVQEEGSGTAAPPAPEAARQQAAAFQGAQAEASSQHVVQEAGPRIPSPETQKLMQSAGKALRAP